MNKSFLRVPSFLLVLDYLSLTEFESELPTEQIHFIFVDIVHYESHLCPFGFPRVELRESSNRLRSEKVCVSLNDIPDIKKITCKLDFFARVYFSSLNRKVFRNIVRTKECSKHLIKRNTILLSDRFSRQRKQSGIQRCLQQIYIVALENSLPFTLSNQSKSRSQCRRSPWPAVKKREALGATILITEFFPCGLTAQSASKRMPEMVASTASHFSTVGQGKEDWERD